jgi:hypothetical protein
MCEVFETLGCLVPNDHESLVIAGDASELPRSANRSLTKQRDDGAGIDHSAAVRHEVVDL